MNENAPISLAKLTALMAVIYLIEIGLILAQIIPVVLSFSPGDLLFSLVNFLTVIYASVAFAKSGLNRVALNGAILSFIGPVLISVAVVVSMLYIHIPILGALIANNTQLLMLLVSLVLLNVSVGIATAVLTAVIRDKINRYVARIKSEENGERKSLLFFCINPASLVLSLILFLICLSYNLPVSSNLGFAIIILYSFIMIFYTIVYGINLRRPTASLSGFAAASFCISIALFLASTILFLPVSQSMQGKIIMALNFGTYFIMFSLIFFIARLYFLSKNRESQLIVIAAVVAIVAIFFVLAVATFNPDDEILISYYGIQHMLNGINPYSQSISSTLYAYLQHSPGTALTVSTNGSILGAMDYPALYFIVQTPFYLLSNTSLQYLQSSFFNYQMFAFFLLLLLSYALVKGRKWNSGLDLLVIILLTVTTLFYLTSMIVYLMLALIVLMYSNLANKYSWLILGLMASLQEQLWIIVLLFIAYSFNNYGAKRGLKDLLGASAVFLVINGYFIFIAPSSYVSSFIGPVSEALPSSASTIGFLLASNYQVPLYTYTYLFLISIVLSVLISLYLNEKKLILLLSIVPFLFLSHSHMFYYAVPIIAFAMVINANAITDARDRVARAMAKKRAMAYAFVAAIALCISAMFVITYVSHLSYNNELGLYAYNQSIEETNITTITYHAQLSYNPKNVTYLYLLIGDDSNGTITYAGLYNHSLIKNSLNCSFPCSVDVNRIVLPSSGHYNLTATFPPGVTTPAYFFAVLSNNDYYYETQSLEYG